MKQNPEQIEDIKWERKKYMKQCKRDTVMDILKIRLQMWYLKKNYRKMKKAIVLIMQNTQQSMYLIVEKMKIQNGEISKIILKKNGMKWFKYLERTREKEKKEKGSLGRKK